MKQYDIVYSLGRDCACAMYLIENQLRLTSGPFDWLTNASFEMRCELILNDFKGFLDKEKFKPMPKPTAFPSDPHNDYYEHTLTKFYFWHDFPTGMPFDSTYPHVKEKYERRIKRFYDNIKTKKRVLFVWLSMIDKTDDAVIQSYHKKFCKKFGKNVDFLIIEHKENTLEKKPLSESVIRWWCHAQKIDEKGVPQTQGNKEIIQQIFENYSVFIPLITMIKRKVINFFVCFFCLLLPVKAWRKKIKRKLKN